MIADDQELNVTLDRIAKFQRQVSHLRNVETNPEMEALMWEWSKNRRYVRVAMCAAGVIVSMAISGVIVFGSLAGDSFPFTAGFQLDPDFVNGEAGLQYQNLQWFCSMALIGGVLLGLGAYASDQIYGRGEKHK